jgi:hypothetical protein
LQALKVPEIAEKKHGPDPERQNSSDWEKNITNTTLIVRFTYLKRHYEWAPKVQI